jgi:hypothetical protein
VSGENPIFINRPEQNSGFVSGFVLFSAALKFSGNRLNPFHFLELPFY